MQDLEKTNKIYFPFITFHLPSYAMISVLVNSIISFLNVYLYDEVINSFKISNRSTYRVPNFPFKESIHES